MMLRVGLGVMLGFAFLAGPVRADQAAGDRCAGELAPFARELYADAMRRVAKDGVTPRKALTMSIMENAFGGRPLDKTAEAQAGACIDKI
jgi:hypothetical protein